MWGAVRVAGVLAAVSVLAGAAQPSVPRTAAHVGSSPAATTGSAPSTALALQLRVADAAKPGGGPTSEEGTAGANPDCAKLKCVALTMDDGPVAHTADVLALLRREKVHATFFLLGQNARKHPALVRRMIADGNVVGNHSWNHPEFWHLSRKAIRHQLARTDALLKRITGKRPTLVRPPFGEVDARVRKVARDRGQPLILWDVDPTDWKDHKASTVAKRVVTRARRGSIILTHDVWPSTRHAYARIIHGLKARGFTLVTVPQLLGDKTRPGRAYFRR